MEPQVPAPLTAATATTAPSTDRRFDGRAGGRDHPGSAVRTGVQYVQAQVTITGGYFNTEQFLDQAREVQAFLPVTGFDIAPTRTRSQRWRRDDNFQIRVFYAPTRRPPRRRRHRDRDQLRRPPMSEENSFGSVATEAPSGPVRPRRGRRSQLASCSSIAGAVAVVVLAVFGYMLFGSGGRRAARPPVPCPRPRRPQVSRRQTRRPRPETTPPTTDTSRAGTPSPRSRSMPARSCRRDRCRLWHHTYTTGTDTSTGTGTGAAPPPRPPRPRRPVRPSPSSSSR